MSSGPAESMPTGFCGACGSLARHGAAFCGTCGSALRGGRQASPAQEPAAAEAPSAGPPAARAVGPSGRTWALVGLGAGVVAVAMGTAFVLGVFDGGSAQPTPPPAPAAARTQGQDAGGAEPDLPAATGTLASPAATGQTRTVDVVPLAEPAGGRRCFATRPGRATSLTLAGVKYRQANLQCGDAAGVAGASGGFDVDLASEVGDGEITDFVATVGIDEASASGVASADWEVSYGGAVICEASTGLGAPATCEAHGLSIPVSVGVPLRLTQSIRARRPGRSLWAGFHQPSVTLAGAGRSAAQAGAGPTDPASALDRIFLLIKAGDYSAGAEAEGLYARLTGTGDPLAGNAAFNVGVIRYADGDCTGAYDAFAAAAATPGTDAQNRLRAGAIAAAADGCRLPAGALVGP